MKIVVSAYVPSKGGFLQDVVLDIPEELAERLKGCSYKWVSQNNYITPERDTKYWDAVFFIKQLLALRLGISFWNESYDERSTRGDADAPISINTIKRYQGV